MTTPRTTAGDGTGLNGAGGPFPADVVAFAAAHGAEGCLQPLLEVTKRLFPTARSIQVCVEEDPELRDNTTIAFHVQIAGLPLDEVRAAERRWIEESRRIYPPLRKILFCLLLDLKL